MKIRITILSISVGIILFSCEKEQSLNKQPAPPVLMKPQTGAVTGIENVHFTWQKSVDPEGDEVKYTFYISSDSSSWETQELDENELELNSLNPGIKYYWKVSAKNYNINPEEAQEDKLSISETSYFFTTPPGVSSLRDSAKNGQLMIYWDDPDDLDYVEISFSPLINSISQPLQIAAGVEMIELSGLQNETIYTVLVTAHYINGLNSNPDTLMDMSLLPNQVHDVDFNIYTIITLGTQTWIRENLKVSRFQDGSPFQDGYYQPVSLSEFTGSESEKYGLYYRSVITSGGYDSDKNPCPCGYHVPADSEWKVLESYLGMTDADLNSTDYMLFRGENENVGKILKSKTGWSDYEGESGNGSDLYGFTVLPAGYIYDDTEYKTDSTAIFWALSDNRFYNNLRLFSNSSAGIQRYQSGGMMKASIRCIKD